jgi:hypothetical protein
MMEVHRGTTNNVDLDPSALCTPHPKRELVKGSLRLLSQQNVIDIYVIHVGFPL